jgi:hypothetical protein
VNRNQADLGVTLAAALLACGAVAIHAPVGVTAVLGIALIAAPGYLWSQILLGPQISAVERAAVATGIALSVPILGGLLLYAARLPLHRAEWIGLLAGVTLAGDVVLFLRRRSDRSPREEPTSVRRPRPLKHIAAFTAATMILVGAVVLARVGVAMQSYPGFTQLWMTPSKSATTATLGVGNHEGRTVRYRLVLLRGGRAFGAWNIMLANGHDWHRSQPINGSYTWIANLYRLPDSNHPYRQVVINNHG